MSEEAQTIFKVNRVDRSHYAQIENSTITDARLSFKATGLLCYLLSLPNDWAVRQGHLSTVKTDGRDSVIAGFKELQSSGYVEKQYIRNESGQIVTTVWHVNEIPKGVLPKSENPISVPPISDKPLLQRAEEDKDQKEQADAAAPGAKVKPSIKSKVPKMASCKGIAFADWFKTTLPQGFKLSESWRMDWAIVYDEMIRLDARTAEQIWKVCKWARGHHFWLSNFQSPRKLRQKDGSGVMYFDIFLSQSNEQKNPTNGHRQPSSASHSNAGTSNASAASQY